MSNVSIKLANLSKAYKVRPKRDRGFLSGKLLDLLRPASGQHGEDLVWALRDLSLELKHGELVGFIGPNGAGKSTLLKILARITKPTSGIGYVNGRIGSLLEVGTGFHPELTGRENIFLNGSILGMTRKEINSKLEEIIDFSGVEHQMDTPVKFFSTGQYTRLGFAVAAHLESEILIVDEVLAVGDAEFQSKCLNKMLLLTGEGRTILFVSHQLDMVLKVCTKAVWLNGGRIIGTAEPKTIVSKYEHWVNSSDKMLPVV